MSSLQATIDAAWEMRTTLAPASAPPAIREAVSQVIAELDAGRLRVAERIGTTWTTHQWIKKAVLLSFRLHDNEPMQFDSADGHTPPFAFYDKVRTKFAGMTGGEFAAMGVRVVPPAVARRGAYIANNVVLMPSYVHLSGGVGIGGVLEPLQANPTIIEDNCFIGARSEVVEGVIVEENSVLGMGVFVGQSTKIYDRSTGKVSYGRIPAGSVVVAGNLPAADGSHSLYCAVIVKQVDAKTRAKTSINELLRA
jgi:2,3,4,5-tetrahydropyridine-2-carboxylate N-succinyltransferase